MIAGVADAGQRARAVLTLWVGQLVSVVGSGLTTFALGVWVYRRTGSATQYALIALFGMLPSVVLGPIAGALVDRWHRRTALLVADAIAGVTSLALVALVYTDRLSLAAIFVAVAASAVAAALRYPAYSAVVTVLVPKQHLGRAAGLVQAADATAQLVCPLAAGAIVVRAGIAPILVIDVASFVVALASILMSRIPRTAPPPRRSFLGEMSFGMGYLAARPGLLALLVFFAVCNLLDGIVVVLASPMILSLGSAEDLGLVLSLGGCGMLAGTLAMSVWGGPRRRIEGILWAEVACGAAVIAAGIPRAIPPIAAAAFALFFLNALVNALSQAVWQSKVAAEVQGRVFAVRRMVALSTQPLAFLVAGPLADRIAEPLLAPGGGLASTVGRIVGVGPGRGIAFLFLVVGAGTMLVALGAMAYGRLRRLEAELPDG